MTPRILTFALIVAMLCRPAGSVSHRRVVVLHSYHQGLSWVDAVNAGLESALAGMDPPVELRFEYLDTKTPRSSEHLELEAALLARKYRKSPPELVIISDNNALEFFRNRRDAIFGPVPAVFCGINDFSPRLLDGLDRVTGVAEGVSFRDNLELIRRLHPNLTRIVVYGIDTTTYRINKTRLLKVADRLGMRPLLEFREGLSAEEVVQDAASLGSGSVILLIETLRSQAGIPLDFRRACEELRRTCRAPLYGFWDFFLGHGIVGGRLVSGRAHGEAAGRLARRVLEGEDPDRIPVVTSGVNPWMFDYRELKRLGIRASALPEGSRILFRPPTLWERYGQGVIYAGVFAGIAVLVLVLQAVDTLRQRRARRNVKRARDFLQDVLDGVAEPILVIGLDYRILLRNRAARKAARDPEGITCHRFAYGLDAPCPADETPCPLEMVRRSGRAVTVTHIHPRADGETRHMEILASPLFDTGGRLEGVVETVRDVTDRVRAFERIQWAKEEWERTFDAVPDLIAILDDQYRIVRANRAMAEALGFDPADLVGRRCFEVVHGTDAPPPDCPHAQFLEDGRVHVAEIWEPRLKAHLLVSASPLGARKGLCVHVARDITELKQAHAALETERNRLRVTLESIVEGVIATDAEGRVTLLNPAAERLTGWAECEAVGRPLEEVFRVRREDSGSPVANPVEQVFAKGKVVVLGTGAILSARDGTERVIADSAAPIRGPEGRILGAVVVFRDVTEERRREEERSRAQHLESLGILAGGIAHDFNNLLMGISANLEAARRGLPVSHPAYGQLARAEAACFRATQLTRQLLTFAKGGEPSRCRFSLADHLDEWASFPLRGSNVKLELEVPEGLWPLDADPGQIEQVVTNLVLNARQAMPGGGTARITARNHEVGPGHPTLAPGRYVMLEVRDSGHGIPEEHLSRIFDPYFSTKQTGSGLGLATVHSIVRRHGGTVQVESALGTGSTFRVFLPASDVEPEVGPQREDRERGEDGRGFRILVMDDEEMIRDVVVGALESMGHEAAEAADGQEAVKAYRRAMVEGRPFDLVILDLTVPAGMGGKEAVEELRKVDPDVKAIASSGYAADPVLAHPERYGFAAAIAKPYRLAELARVIERVLAG